MTGYVGLKATLCSARLDLNVVPWIVAQFRCNWNLNQHIILLAPITHWATTRRWLTYLVKAQKACPPFFVNLRCHMLTYHVNDSYVAIRHYDQRSLVWLSGTVQTLLPFQLNRHGLLCSRHPSSRTSWTRDKKRTFGNVPTVSKNLEEWDLSIPPKPSGRNASVLTISSCVPSAQ